MCMSTVIFAKKHIRILYLLEGVPWGFFQGQQCHQDEKVQGKKVIGSSLWGGGHDDTKPEGTTVA